MNTDSTKSKNIVFSQTCDKEARSCHALQPSCCLDPCTAIATWQEHVSSPSSRECQLPARPSINELPSRDTVNFLVGTRTLIVQRRLLATNTAIRHCHNARRRHFQSVHQPQLILIKLDRGAIWLPCKSHTLSGFHAFACSCSPALPATVDVPRSIYAVGH